MYAIVGIPGSTHHDWRWFPHTKEGRRAAQKWMHATFESTLRDNPVLGSLPTRLISDREAQAVRYRDGRRVYDQEVSIMNEARAEEAEQGGRAFWAEVLADEEARHAQDRRDS